ncbi:MAG: TlpA disulfide reductase family protein [Bacteroidetes bacterium]|nr:TlpA disulfide reductase family protein [Bacteroidota bacterium]
MKILSTIGLLLSGTVILLFSCKQKGDDKQGTISGKLTNSGNTMVYLERFDDKGEYILDSSKTDAEGNFTLGNKATEKDYYVIRTDKSNMVFLLLDGKENIQITGDGKKMEKTYTVKGSEDCELIRVIKDFDGHLTDSLNVVYSTRRETDPSKKDSVGPVLQKYYATVTEKFAKEFISAHPKSLVALSTIRYLDQQKDIQVYENLLISLQGEYPSSKFVKDFEVMVANLKKLPAGSQAPEIRLNTPEGKELSLSSFKGKIILLDFWASWCGPCRRENPHIVEMYKKFKNKNFEIFGVSLDENVSAWKEAIKKDGITWPQVSELKRWESQVVKLYQVEAIPYTVLLDKEGKVIAKGLVGAELEQKLVEILN